MKREAARAIPPGAFFVSSPFRLPLAHRDDRAVTETDPTVHQVEAKLLLLNIARARHHRPVHFTAVFSEAATFNFGRTPVSEAAFGP